MPSELQEACTGAALAIWTTTPWTMPANAAVAVNEKLQYSLVEVQVSCNLADILAQGITCQKNKW